MCTCTSEKKKSNKIGVYRIKSKDLFLPPSSYPRIIVTMLNSLVCVPPDPFCFFHLIYLDIFEVHIEIKGILLMSARVFHNKDIL